MILIGLVLIVLIPVASRWRRGHVERALQESIDASRADVADLLIVMLGAGSSLTECLGWLAERGPEPTRLAFAAVIERTNAGLPLTSALAGVADDLGADYRPMVAALSATLRDGAPVSSLLMRLGDEARDARRRRNERRARSLPVKMLFPLVCCSLPAVVVGAVVPLVMVAIGRL